MFDALLSKPQANEPPASKEGVSLNSPLKKNPSPFSVSLSKFLFSSLAANEGNAKHNVKNQLTFAC
jgi:hypothetical protein